MKGNHWQMTNFLRFVEAMGSELEAKTVQYCSGANTVPQCPSLVAVGNVARELAFAARHALHRQKVPKLRIPRCRDALP